MCVHLIVILTVSTPLYVCVSDSDINSAHATICVCASDSDINSVHATICVCASDNDINSVHDTVNRVLVGIDNWLKANRLSLNVSQT